METDTEYITTEYKYPNCTVRVHRPVLTEEERARRMKIIERAAINILLEVEKNKSRKEKAAEEQENETISK